MFDAISVADLQQMFLNTIVRYDGAPVRIDKISNGKDLTLSNVLNNEKLFIRNITDPKFDFSPLPLGMVNDVNGCAYWVTRAPRRQWKQGTSLDNVKIDKIPTPNGGGYSETLDFYGKGLVECINNVYPGIVDVVTDLAEGKTYSRAVHKMFAISGKEFLIIHRKTRIGKLNKDNGVPEFYKGFEHLQHVFEDVKWQT